MNYQSELSAFLNDSLSYKTIPIVESFTVDTLSPVQMIEKLDREITYFLESKDESSDWSRYSFIGLNPFLTIKEKDGAFHACEEEKHLISKPHLKQMIEWMNEAYKIKIPELDIPFTGGAVGYLSYDFIPLIEPSVQPHRDVTDLEKCMLFVCQTIIAFDHELKKVHFIHYARLNGTESDKEKEKVFLENQQSLKRLVTKLSEPKETKDVLLSTVQQKEKLSDKEFSSNYEKSRFLKDVEKLKEYIRSGDIFQGVLSQRFEMPVKTDAFELYRVLRMVNPSPYMYYIKLPDRELVGSSPERLIHIQNGHLEIHPIAGTRKRGANQKEDDDLKQDLLADEKELAEHYMLVDLARNDIGRVAEYGSVNVPELTKVVSFSHVMHIISIVTGVLREGIHPVDALMSAFPAGTLSGSPKIRAMQLLNELEPTPRETYAGCIAYIGFDGNIDSCITIRTMSIKDGIASVQAGAGIVADSVPEKEWEESLNKAAALLDTIKIAEDIFADREEKVYELTTQPRS
ncbi:anthranilate synthase component I [Bacillus gobiensis]|uniref:anthranilate synthase component I n=1 Tax=Bacillus gobiensis TaxID=1441095 RepID=UPI003D259C52